MAYKLGKCSLLVFTSILFGLVGELQATNHIQQAWQSDVSGTTYRSFSATFTAPTTTGNAIIVGLTYGNANAAITAIDSAGDNFVTAIKTYDSGHRQGCAILYAINITGAVSSRVTLKFTGAVAYLALAIHEYSGLAALDVVSGMRGTGSHPTSGSIQTTSDGDLIFGSGVEDAIGYGDNLAAGAGFTEREDLGSAAAYADEDELQNLAGQASATWNLSPASSWIADVAAFRASGAGGTTGGSAPSLTSASPTSGAVGTAVTLTGSNFGATQGTSTVSFNGTTATPTSWSATSIVAPVPSGATTGNVVVTVGGQGSNGVAFTVTASAPSLTSVSPTSGTVGSAVTLTGSNFGATQGISTVSFNGTRATPTSWSMTSIVAPVPSGASTGNVVVTVGGQASNGMSFTVTSGGSATPTLVQHVSGASTQNNAISSYQIRLANPTQGGNCVIVGVRSDPSGATPVVSDDAGDVYTVVVGNNDGGGRVTLLVALNVATGAQAITIQFGGATSYVSAVVSEFNNVAVSGAYDGTCASSNTSNTISCGTISTTAAGDLLYSYVEQDSTANPISSWGAGSGASLLSADIQDSHAAQYQITGAAGSYPVGMQMTPAENWNVVGVALRSAPGGSPQAGGMHIDHLQHNEVLVNSPFKVQLPSSGNLIIAAWIGSPGTDITSISDSMGNSYIQVPNGKCTGTTGSSGDAQIFYAANAVSSSTLALTVSFSGANANSTLNLYDVSGAATAPLDTEACATGSQGSLGDVTGVTVTPSTVGGLITTVIGVADCEVTGLAGAGMFDSVVTNPIFGTGALDENNGWGHLYNSSLSPFQSKWTVARTPGCPTGGVDEWANIAAAFKAGP
jgi:hypothetical protein